MPLAHFAVRGLRHEACQVGEDPDRLSFSHSCQVIRRNPVEMVLLAS